MNNEELKIVRARTEKADEILRKIKTWQDWTASLDTVTRIEMTCVKENHNQAPVREVVGAGPWGMGMEDSFRDSMLQELRRIAAARIAALGEEYDAL